MCLICVLNTLHDLVLGGAWKAAALKLEESPQLFSSSSGVKTQQEGKHKVATGIANICVSSSTHGLISA